MQELVQRYLGFLVDIKMENKLRSLQIIHRCNNLRKCQLIMNH